MEKTGKNTGEEKYGVNILILFSFILLIYHFSQPLKATLQAPPSVLILTLYSPLSDSISLFIKIRIKINKWLLWDDYLKKKNLSLVYMFNTSIKPTEYILKMWQQT